MLSTSERLRDARRHLATNPHPGGSRCGEIPSGLYLDSNLSSILANAAPDVHSAGVATVGRRGYMPSIDGSAHMLFDSQDVGNESRDTGVGVPSNTNSNCIGPPIVDSTAPRRAHTADKAAIILGLGSRKSLASARTQRSAPRPSPLPLRELKDTALATSAPYSHVATQTMEALEECRRSLRALDTNTVSASAAASLTGVCRSDGMTMDVFAGNGFVYAKQAKQTEMRRLMAEKKRASRLLYLNALARNAHLTSDLALKRSIYIAMLRGSDAAATGGTNADVNFSYTRSPATVGNSHRKHSRDPRALGISWRSCDSNDSNSDHRSSNSKTNSNGRGDDPLSPSRRPRRRDGGSTAGRADSLSQSGSSYCGRPEPGSATFPARSMTEAMIGGNGGPPSEWSRGPRYSRSEGSSHTLPFLGSAHHGPCGSSTVDGCGGGRASVQRMEMPSGRLFMAAPGWDEVTEREGAEDRVEGDAFGARETMGSVSQPGTPWNQQPPALQEHQQQNRQQGQQPPVSMEPSVSCTASREDGWGSSDAEGVLDNATAGGTNAFNHDSRSRRAIRSAAARSGFPGDTMVRNVAQGERALALLSAVRVLRRQTEILTAELLRVCGEDDVCTSAESNSNSHRGKSVPHTLDGRGGAVAETGSNLFRDLFSSSPSALVTVEGISRRQRATATLRSALKGKAERYCHLERTLREIQATSASVDPVAATVKEDGDVDSAASKRRLALLGEEIDVLQRFTDLFATPFTRQLPPPPPTSLQLQLYAAYQRALSREPKPQRVDARVATSDRLKRDGSERARAGGRPPSVQDRMRAQLAQLQHGRRVVHAAVEAITRRYQQQVEATAASAAAATDAPGLGVNTVEADAAAPKDLLPTPAVTLVPVCSPTSRAATITTEAAPFTERDRPDVRTEDVLHEISRNDPAPPPLMADETNIFPSASAAAAAAIDTSSGGSAEVSHGDVAVVPALLASLNAPLPPVTTATGAASKPLFQQASKRCHTEQSTTALERGKINSPPTAPTAAAAPAADVTPVLWFTALRDMLVVATATSSTNAHTRGQNNREAAVARLRDPSWQRELAAASAAWRGMQRASLPVEQRAHGDRGGRRDTSKDSNDSNDTTDSGVGCGFPTSPEGGLRAGLPHFDTIRATIRALLQEEHRQARIAATAGAAAAETSTSDVNPVDPSGEAARTERMAILMEIDALIGSESNTRDSRTESSVSVDVAPVESREEGERGTPSLSADAAGQPPIFSSAPKQPDRSVEMAKASAPVEGSRDAERGHAKGKTKPKKKKMEIFSKLFSCTRA